MASFSSVVLLSIFLLITTCNTISSKPNSLSSFLVSTVQKSRPTTFTTRAEWHFSMVSSITKNTFHSDNRIFYDYDVVFSGFAARLTSEEAAELKKMAGVSAVIEDRMKTRLLTTRTPEFLGLHENTGLWPMARFGSDIIIGLVDTGVWPESASFTDDGMEPVVGWNGSCDFDYGLCNNKLIGAKSFLTGYKHFVSDGLVEDGEDYTPRDIDGHGTHTASTAAGTSVEGVNLFGFADGTARGIAFNAKIAIYKACLRSSSCAESDILAAMDSAVQDGVHVLSLSLGGPDVPYYDNYVAIGAFAALSRGIFVVCAAGNSGPTPYSVENTAPWITTVGAGDIDRNFPVSIILENGREFVGSSLYVSSSDTFTTQTYQLIYHDDCGTTSSTLDYLKGKILVCTGSAYIAFKVGITVQEAGGKGVIVLNSEATGEGLLAVPFTLPGAIVGFNEGIEIRNYISTTENPMESFTFPDVTYIGSKRAPIVAAFSSRGPNHVVHEILKPDLIAPGSNILAAFPPSIPPSHSSNDNRRVFFNFMSGTSMACPHVAGVAALLMAVHRHWSPAAIRSALMTTASVVDSRFNIISRYADLQLGTPLDFGAGHIEPERAVDPGLVYDTDVSEYIDFMCSLHYSIDQMRVFVKTTDPCPAKKVARSPADLNYPSISVVLGEGIDVRQIVRTVTNVAEMVVPERYNVLIVNPRLEKVKISVEPSTLTFTTVMEKQSFVVKIIGNGSYLDDPVSGYIVWISDKQHFVKSPFVILWE